MAEEKKKCRSGMIVHLSREKPPKRLVRLGNRSARGRGFSDRVQHDEIVYRSQVSNGCNIDTCLNKLMSIRLTLVAEDVIFISDDKSWWLSPELVDRGL
jgi:hypothetical protein